MSFKIKKNEFLSPLMAVPGLGHNILFVIIINFLCVTFCHLDPWVNKTTCEAHYENNLREYESDKDKC